MPYEFEMPQTKGPLAERRAQRMAMAEAIEQMSEDTGFKFGPRGWAYYAEGLGLITKGEFARFEKLLTDMRKAGELDPDVIEPDASRIATEVFDFEANDYTPDEQAEWAVSQISDELDSYARGYFQNGFWEGLDCYVEMIVEKKDLVQIFGDVAKQRRVRITNGKGDTDIHSRLAMLKRFRDHHEAGRRCILLAVGDHDPKGLGIVAGLRHTLMSCADLKGLDWYDPEFEVINIGLTEEQIDDLKLMKIPNLETGGGKDLSNPRHPDHHKPYVQDYIAQYGVWKVEANALVANPRAAQRIFTDAVEEFIPESHLAYVRAENQPGQKAVRTEIERLMQSWTFGD